jgi:sterol desaturase/sphingolipid hydroxylase (fatty acid hydroxylase superfamily)
MVPVEIQNFPHTDFMDTIFLVFYEAIIFLELLLERQTCSIRMSGPFSELRRCDRVANVSRLCCTHLEIQNLYTVVGHKEESFNGLKLCELRSGLALIPQKAAGVVVSDCGIYLSKSIIHPMIMQGRFHFNYCKR